MVVGGRSVCYKEAQYVTECVPPRERIAPFVDKANVSPSMAVRGK